MGEQKSRNLQSEELLGFKSTTKETSDLNKNESVKLPEIIETNDEVLEILYGKGPKVVQNDHTIEEDNDEKDQDKNDFYLLMERLKQKSDPK